MSSTPLMRTIRRKLTFFQTEVVNDNKNNRFDINRDAELFYKPILNIIFDAEFEVLEYSEKNTPGVDLGCKKQKLAVQVTSETGNSKIKNSIEKFIKYKFYNEYDKFYILYIGREIDFHIRDLDLSKFITNELGKQSLAPDLLNGIIREENFWDIPKLQKEIEKRFFEKPKTLKKIDAYLCEQLEDLHKNQKFDYDLFNVVSSLNEETRKQPNILEALVFLFEKFENLLVIPLSILSKLYPFSKTDDSATYYSQFSLYTDNDDLFEFFDKLSAGNFSQVPGHETSEGDFNIKVKSIIDVLKFNLIHHLYRIDHRSERICIHKLFENSQCTCERCCYERFDFNGSSNAIKGDVGHLNNFEALRHTYVHYQFGNFKTAYELYKILRDRFYAENKYMSYFICQYNLTNLLFFFRTHYWKEDRDTILTELRGINLDVELMKVKDEGLDKEQVLFLKWINEERFMDRAIWSVTKTVREIRRSHHSDQFGGFTSNSNLNELLVGCAQMSIFIGMNFIIYDDFSEYSEIIYVAFEGFVAAASIQNGQSSKLNKFNDFIIDLALFYGESEVIDGIFNKYHLKSLKYKIPEEGEQTPFFTRIDNFCASANGVESLIDMGSDEPNYFFRDKYNRYFKNIIVIMSRMEMSEADLNKYMYRLLEIVQQVDFINPASFAEFHRLLDHKSYFLSQQNFENLLLISLTIKKYYKTSSISTFVDRYKQAHPYYILSNIKIIEALLKPFENHDVSKGKLVDLLDFWGIATPDLKIMIKEKIELQLAQNFYADLYYTAVMEDAIDYFPLLDEFIKTVPRTSNQVTFRESFTGQKDDKNYRLNELINLGYKYNLDLQEERFQSLHEENPYYKWLLNLETFDYSQFIPYWLLEYKTTHYFNAFKKIPKIHEEIKKSMLKHPMEGLSQIYFKFFVD